MAKIKICGLFREQDISYVNEVKPDYVGFIINFPKSYRSVTIETAKKLKEKLDPSIEAIGVFVDEDIDTVICAAKSGIFDMIQLHGSEDEEYIRKVKKKGKKPVIKAYIVSEASDVQKAKKSSADYILFDKGRGEGVPFDWRLISDFERPFFLAGGIDIANVSMAIMMGKPYAVDVSSGVETERKKDREKIKKIVSVVHEIKENTFDKADMAYIRGS